RGSLIDALSRPSGRRRRRAAAHSGTRRPAASLRLPSLAPVADPRGLSHEPETLPPALPRGEAAGEQTWWPQAGIGRAGADRTARWSQRALVARLRIRQLHGRPALPHPGDRRRLHAREPGVDPGYIPVRRTCGP